MLYMERGGVEQQVQETGVMAAYANGTRASSQAAASTREVKCAEHEKIYKISEIMREAEGNKRDPPPKKLMLKTNHSPWRRSVSAQASGTGLGSNVQR